MTMENGRIRLGEWGWSGDRVIEKRSREKSGRRLERQSLARQRSYIFGLLRSRVASACGSASIKQEHTWAHLNKSQLLNLLYREALRAILVHLYGESSAKRIFLSRHLLDW